MTVSDANRPTNSTLIALRGTPARDRAASEAHRTLEGRPVQERRRCPVTRSHPQSKGARLVASMWALQFAALRAPGDLGGIETGGPEFLHTTGISKVQLVRLFDGVRLDPCALSSSRASAPAAQPEAVEMDEDRGQRCARTSASASTGASGRLPIITRAWSEIVQTRHLRKADRDPCSHPPTGARKRSRATKAGPGC